jgi:hypothetical protein
MEPVRVAPETELLDALMMDAYQAGDQGRFIELAGQRREMMSDEEKAGRQAIAGYASQILERVPREQWQAAIRQAMEQLGIDPSQTTLDDITDPAQLEQALRLEIARGDPEAALRAANLPFERVDLGNRDAPFNPRTGAYGAGVERGIDPDTRFSQQEQTRRNREDNAVQQRIAEARIAADRAEAAARIAQGAEKLRLEAAALDLRRQEQALTREWMQGGSAGGSMPGSAGITWGQ